MWDALQQAHCRIDFWLALLGGPNVVNAGYGGADVPVPDGVGPNSSMVALSE